MFMKVDRVKMSRTYHGAECPDDAVERRLRFWVTHFRSGLGLGYSRPTAMFRLPITCTNKQRYESVHLPELCSRCEDKGRGAAKSNLLHTNAYITALHFSDTTLHTFIASHKPNRCRFGHGSRATSGNLQSEGEEWKAACHASREKD